MAANARRNSWAITVPLAAVAAAYFWFAFLPGRKALADIRGQCREQELYIARSSEVVKKTATLRTKLTATEGYVAKRRTSLASEKNLPQVFAKVQATVQSTGAQATRFEPRAAVVYETLKKSPVRLVCTGTSAQVFELVRKLDATLPEVSVEFIRVESREQDRRNIATELDLVVFSDISGRSDHEGSKP